MLENKIEAMKKLKEEGKEIPSDMKVKVVVLADSPTVATGFGHVCREILGLLYKTGYYDFEIVGINYDGSPHNLPYRIHPAYNGLIPSPLYRDVYGRQKFLDLLGEGRFDIAWVLQDSFILEQDGFGKKIAQTYEMLRADSKFAFIFYFPIDATPKISWIDNSAMLSHHPVTYTRYAYEEVLKLYSVDENSLLTDKEKEEMKMKYESLKSCLNIIYHGINTKNFFPKTPEEKAELKLKLFGEHNKDKFVFINVNRNQPRKDIFRTMQAFKKLLDQRRAAGKDDVYLYLHCNVFDSGLNLLDMAKQLQLVEGDEFAFPDPKMFNTSHGVPLELVNELYNASDALVTTTLGEGWGLSVTEAMACKLPVIAPDHTSLTEMLGKSDNGNAERGFLVKTKEYFVQHDDNSRMRPITDVDDLVEKMEFVIENYKHIGGIVNRAYEWVKMLEWDGELVGGKWKLLFEEAYNNYVTIKAVQVDEALADEIRRMKLGVNDDCPVCHVKYKKCRHYATE